MCSYIISVVYIYMSYHILFEGIYFALTYAAHIYGMHLSLEIHKK